jgi:hypothetical protein
MTYKNLKARDGLGVVSPNRRLTLVLVTFINRTAKKVTFCHRLQLFSTLLHAKKLKTVFFAHVLFRSVSPPPIHVCPRSVFCLRHFQAP